MIVSTEERLKLAPADPQPIDVDPSETQEWLESLEAVVRTQGLERAKFLLQALLADAHKHGVRLPYDVTSPYVNTISLAEQPHFPGIREIERRIKSIIRWNAMAMVVRAGKYPGLGGHISTYASAATLYEVGFNHFFKGNAAPGGADIVYYQGHASPGIYARAFLEGRLTEEHLENFRRELQPHPGVSSYPHPYLMPNFWQFPTVSMGLGPLMAIYQARFMRYLEHRGLADTSQRHVWAFLGDGECDEPETLGAISLAAREKLDNLIFVINCNLQRLDGPVRGNGKIIQELEGVFRGAGWNVIKVIWGSDWDPLFAADKDGHLVRRVSEVVDGEYQRLVVHSERIREDFFNTPELQALVAHLTDQQLAKLRRGGHDPEKVYAAYKAAVECVGRPTVVLAKTIKGYGLGEAGEGRNIAHNSKKVNENELRNFRSRFGIPISDEQIDKVPFYKPAEDSEEMRYLRARREALGGFHPERQVTAPPLTVPGLDYFEEFLRASTGTANVATTQAFGRILIKLLRHPEIGKLIVPIIPDEARTFGLESLFSQFGIYSSVGQVYEPVDRSQMMYYREAIDGQVLEEGINEAGAMGSFIAAGTAYSAHGVNTIPFYIYYSMFGFQRVGDLIWAAADSLCKGFLCGATAGRTTLNGEGLQHEDGHSHVTALTIPNLMAYDASYAYELAVIIQDGIRRMYGQGENIFYYITMYNEPAYPMPAMPQGVAEGITKGMYRLKTVEVPGSKRHVNLLGSGMLLQEVLKAADLLAERYGVASTVYAVTSYKELRRDAMEAARWNMLHPEQPRRVSYVESLTANAKGPFIASSDYMRTWAEQIAPYLPGGLLALGTDGFGRSETRPALRRFFEVDAAAVVVASLYALAERGELDRAVVSQAIRDTGINPDQPAPWTV
jgi:pyruvate dehydrogenase E1 component